MEPKVLIFDQSECFVKIWSSIDTWQLPYPLFLPDQTRAQPSGGGEGARRHAQGHESQNEGGD